jgi:acylphosphatase
MSPQAPSLLRKTCHFSGRVQGVGFRYTVQNLAIRYNVQGFVRNLPDGRVELVMEGPEGDMVGLLDDIRQKMSSNIRGIEIHDASATREFKQFCIKQ